MAPALRGGALSVDGIAPALRGGSMSVAAAVVLFGALTVRAQGPDESTLAAARQLGQEGVALYTQGDYAQASEKLERAYSVVKVPTLGLWSARALEKMGKLVEAAQRYREVTLVALKPGDPEVFRSAHTDASSEYSALLARLPQLTIELAGAGANEAQVTIDGRALPVALIGVPVPVNPGPHELQARRGQDVAREALTLAEGERRTLKLSLRGQVHAPVAAAPQPVTAPGGGALASDAPEPGGDSILPWIVVGAGGALAVTGGVFIALALDARSNVENAPDGTTWSEIEGDHDDVPTYSAVGIALTSAGMAAVIAGLVWKFAGSDGDAQHSVALEASPSQVRLTGTF